MTEDLGETRSGVPVTEELLEQLTAQAEKGFDVEEILRCRGGRPPMRSLAAVVAPGRSQPTRSWPWRASLTRSGTRIRESLRFVDLDAEQDD